MNFKKPEATEIAFWRNERTKQQARLTEEKARVAEINRKYLEGKFVPIEEVVQAIIDVQHSLGVVADRVAKGELVQASEVTEVYQAIEPICSELVTRIVAKTKEAKFLTN